MNTQVKQYGDLNVVEVPGDGPVAMFLHGYGADAYDLAPLANHFNMPAGTRWLFPQAPLEVPVGFGMVGRGWFPIDVAALEKAMQEGSPRDMTRILPDGLLEAQEKVLKCIESAGVSLENLVLGGFSQGAMLSTQITLMGDVPPKGLVILSGTLLNEEAWTKAAPKRKGYGFYQSHGRQDQVLGYPFAQKLEAVLKGAGLVGELQSFEGGHEIPMEVIHGVNNYLQGLNLT